MSTPKHIVAIFGGAVAGAEAAKQLSERGIPVVVFDQNVLPYGKIEDGLPKWHAKLRDKEEERINEKLDHPLVSFVPKARLGETLNFRDVVHNWGFSAVLLATGSWKDRPLPIEGIDTYVNKGLYYQNPFIYWYNHCHEPGYDGPQLETPDGAVIVGGGLASLDVAKALMFQNVERALRARGIEENLFTLDRSIAKVLENHGLTLEELGLQGCTVYYRRRIKDMPLYQPASETPEDLEKAERVREKILRNYISKYLFKVEWCHMPVDKIVEDGRLAGLVMQRTRIENRKVIRLPDSLYEVRAPLVVSSIGSIPEPIEGIPMVWQTYDIDEQDLCRIAGFPNVFALGNAVTGQGNILDSLKHGRDLTQAIAERYFDTFEDKVREKEDAVAKNVAGIAQYIETLPALTEEKYHSIRQKVQALQQAAGYEGDFRQWVERHLPVRLEQLVDGH
jgi:NADPH-dependent glutamate synthase beta subunit-like oxidoreductase